MKTHIRFLKRNKNDLNGNLRLDCSVNGIRFRKYFNISINEKIWNKNRERVKSNYSNAFEINKRLEFITITIQKIYYELINNNIPISVSVLSEKFDEKINGVSRKTSFFDFTNEFVENSKTSKSKGTINGYRCAIKSLKEFEKKFRRRLDWSNFDHKFYTDYQTFQYNIKGNSQNLFGKRISQIKAILNNATKLGLNIHLMFREYKVLKTKSKKEYLNEEEIQLLWDLDLSDKKRLERVRDIFLVCCYTGVRFSEYKNLKKENIELGKNGKSINYYSKKTKKYVHTICNDITFDLLKKYRFNLPHISPQKYNDYIKEVCELAGIDNEILVHSYKAGKAISFKKKKYELIASHTARVSFVTNLHNNCISSSLIKTLTGHSNESMVNNYVHTTAKESIDL
ncbi:MAG: site-specific integrase, partial [Flavobacterium sp.]|nr:site-specific integrase [Flavobacterium sp.]